MYTDLLVRIKNAQLARREQVKVRYSAMDMAVAELLAKHGYLENALKRGRLPKRIIELKLNGNVHDFTFTSKPSRRRYVGYRDLRPVKQGYGLGVISTSRGIMSAAAAKKEKIGGELLFEVW